MARLFWICLGGTFGTALRALIAMYAPRALGTAFPYGTLIVNVVGSFLIGLIMFLGLNTTLISPTLRAALTTGIMGGLTTYSTFNYETLEFFRQGAYLMGGLNFLVTSVGCMLAGIGGLWSARWLIAP